MSKPWIVPIVCSSLIVSASVGAWAAEREEAWPPEGPHVRLDMVGEVDRVAPTGSAWIGEKPATGADDVDECGGKAPVITYCSNGDRRVEDQVKHACTAATDYTGTVESRLVHEEGTRVFVCGYRDGDLQSSHGYGTWPDDRAFHHDCFSYVPGTAGLAQAGPLGPLQAQPTGVPGGKGAWGCWVQG